MHLRQTHTGHVLVKLLSHFHVQDKNHDTNLLSRWQIKNKPWTAEEKESVTLARKWGCSMQTSSRLGLRIPSLPTLLVSQDHLGQTVVCKHQRRDETYPCEGVSPCDKSQITNSSFSIFPKWLSSLPGISSSALETEPKASCHPDIRWWCSVVHTDWEQLSGEIMLWILQELAGSHIWKLLSHLSLTIICARKKNIQKASSSPEEYLLAVTREVCSLCLGHIWIQMACSGASLWCSFLFWFLLFWFVFKSGSNVAEQLATK